MHLYLVSIIIIIIIIIIITIIIVILIFCIAALEIIQMPRSQAIQEGRKLVLSCRTRSLPDVSYRWIKDDIEIPGANRSDLVLEPVRMQDFGRYFCRVWDKSGSLTSEPADVDVFPSPHMSKYGQWRIQGRAPGGLPPPHPLFLDQNESRRAEKFLGGTRSPPPHSAAYLAVSLRKCILFKR